MYQQNLVDNLTILHDVYSLFALAQMHSAAVHGRACWPFQNAPKLIDTLCEAPIVCKLQVPRVVS